MADVDKQKKIDQMVSVVDMKTNLFQQVMEVSGVAMAIRAANLRPLHANNAFLDLYGYTLEELQGLDLVEVMPGDTYALYKELILPTLQGGSSWEGEYTVRTKDGRRFMVWGRFDPVFNDAGQLVSVVSVMRDASDSMRLRNALTQTERHLKFLSENTRDCLFRIRLDDGRYDYISSAVKNLTGYSPRDFYSKPRFFGDIVPVDWHDTVEQWLEDFKEGVVRNRYECPIIHANGTTRWVAKRPTLIRNRRGRPIAVEGIISDITEARQAEIALRTSEEKYRFLAENIADVLWRMDNELNFTFVTPSVQQLWGYTEEEFLNLDYRDFFTPEGLVILQQAQKDRAEAEARGDYGHVNRLTMDHYHKDGHRVYSETAVRRLYDGDNQPICYQGVSRDITERRLHEASLKDSEARFRALFEDSPISLWEEDLTRLKQYFDELKAEGVVDFRTYFYDNPDKLAHCATLVDVVGVNRATLDLLRARSREELIGNLDKVLTESSMAAFTEEMILLASGGCEYCGEITHRTLDGETIWVVVNFQVSPEHLDSLSRVIVSLIDVTPRKRAEQALMESEERYRVVVENAQEGVVVMQNRKAVFVNEAVSEILGYPDDVLTEMDPYSIVHPDDENIARKLFSRFSNGDEREGFATLRLRTGHGETIWVTVNVKPVMWNGAKAYIRIISDITPHKKLVEELRSAHADMEERIRQRTAELSEINLQLTQEIAERQKAQDQIQSLTQQLLRIQEDERQRIARDLHDNVAQDLSSIVLSIETLFYGHAIIEPEILERGKAVAGVARNTIAAVRDIAYGLRPPALDQLGLHRALERQCEEMSLRTGVDIDFSAVGIENVKLDFDTEINVYRMVQEALNNMSKHAGADKAQVRLVGSHPDLLVRVSDNGQGFDVHERISRSVDERHMGLKSMEERARLIGGEMEIQSRVGAGTRIVFKIPITNARRR